MKFGFIMQRYPSPSLRAKRIKKKVKRRQALPSSDQNVQVSDTTGDDSSNDDGKVKKYPRNKTFVA